MKYAKSKDDIPLITHYAALVPKSITIPGDERSRTNPGHGYPESTEKSLDYLVFGSKAEMEQWVAKQEATPFGAKNYRIINAIPMIVQTSHTVTVFDPAK